MNKALGVHSATAWQTNNVTAQVVPQKAACGRARDRKANFSSANSPTDRLSEGVPGQLRKIKSEARSNPAKTGLDSRQPFCCQTLQTYEINTGREHHRR